MTAAAEPVLAAVAPKPGVRLTASTITDDQLDALYAERDMLAALYAEADRLREHAGDLYLMFRELREEEADRADRYQTAWGSARKRARVLSDELTRRAPLTGQYAAALDRVRALHQPRGVMAAAEHGERADCSTCGPNSWPCATIRALEGPSTPRTAPTAALVSPVGLRDAPGATGGLG